MGFPTDFIWGAATSSYQIEGAIYEDGKKFSVWDAFTAEKGRIWKEQNGNAACDHYHRYAEDVALMKTIGLKGYRFSINWPRVLPEGIGKPNHKGIDFYKRLTDLLNEAGIEPWVTLFHWEYPYELYLKGGWLNPDSSDWFSEYAATICTELEDRVSHWITLNEPQCFLELGHRMGIHAPGLKLPFKEILLAAHHVLLGHGKAVQALRASSKKPCEIGYSPVAILRLPHSASKQDREAAMRITFSIQKEDCWNNTWWMDPVYLGHYPKEGTDFFESSMPAIDPNDLKTICQPLNFFGINIYLGHRVRAEKDGTIIEIKDNDGCPTSMLGWPIVPEALYWGSSFFYDRYKLPIIITENGMSNSDTISLDGKVHDPQRIDFIQRYLKELGRAYDDGIIIKGYFHWALIDNFEWTWGYRERFGLVYVDYKTQNRIPKDSAIFYKNVIRSNGKV